MPPSNFDSTWTEQQQAEARNEGWELGLVVDEGRPVQAAYLDVFDHGPQFNNKRAAAMFVTARARERSKLHLAALSAIGASRMGAATRQTRKRK